MYLAKYIITNNFGSNHAFIFDARLNHSGIANKMSMSDIVGAGILKIEGGNLSIRPGSTTLGISGDLLVAYQCIALMFMPENAEEIVEQVKKSLKFKNSK